MLPFKNRRGRHRNLCYRSEMIFRRNSRYVRQRKFYFLSNKEKLALPYIPGIAAKYHLRPITKVAMPAAPIFEGEHRDFLARDDAGRAPKSFAGRDSVEIGYESGAQLKGDKSEAFK